MKIYRLIAELERYGQLEVDARALHSALGTELYMSMESPAHDWKPVWPGLPGEFCEYDEAPLECGMPDLSTWRETGLVLSPKAFKVLETVIAPYGEFVSFDCSGEEYRIFRCTKVIPADMERSRKLTEDGLDLEIQHLNFVSSEVGTTTIFCTDFDNHANLFCSERFRSVVLNEKLTGLEFSEKLETDIF